MFDLKCLSNTKSLVVLPLILTILTKICFGPDDVDFCLKSSQSRFNGQCAPRNYGKTCLQLIIDYDVIIDCKT